MGDIETLSNCLKDVRDSKNTHMTVFSDFLKALKVLGVVYRLCSCIENWFLKEMIYLTAKKLDKNGS